MHKSIKAVPPEIRADLTSSEKRSNTENKQITDNEIGSYIDCIYDEIVCVMSECASAVVPRTRKGFYKFWWDEELSLLKEAAMHANNIWRATGKPKQGQIFINRQQTRLQYRRKIREGHKLQIHCTHIY